MIVDCHTHIWQSPEQLGPMDLGETAPPSRNRPSKAGGEDKAAWRTFPAADPDHHWEQSSAVDRCIVLAFKSRYLRTEIPNAFVSEYVKRYPEKLIGFAGIDPTERGAVDELHAAKDNLQLRGITLSPANQDFHPSDSRAMRLYAEAEKLGMPIMVHPIGQFTAGSKLEYARPYLFDEVARTFPNLKLVIGQMGHPWVEETIVLLGKHAGVFADISGMLCRQWQAYNALVMASQYQITEKLLFGSDFPYTSAVDCIESLYRINQMVLGTNLPIIPRELLRGIVERDSLELLGLT